MAYGYDAEEQVEKLFEIVKVLMDNNNLYKDQLFGIGLSLKWLQKFNTPVFKEMEYLRESNFDIPVVLSAIFNTPIQLGDREKFRRMTYLLSRELTDRVRRPRLIKIYYEYWIREFLKRADDHSFAVGTIILEVIQKLTQDTASIIPNLISELRTKIKEHKREE